MPSNGRALGLDLVRAAAILAVLANHALYLGGVDSVLGLEPSALGVLGVNAFFALSGFLVGAAAIRMVAAGGSVWDFWVRRWLRTLPAALVVLLALAPVLPARDLIGLATFTRFMGGDFERVVGFQHYWTLAVEEWAYLLLPLLLVSAPQVSMRVKVTAAWAVLVCMQQVVIAAGWGGPAPLFTTWLRLDAILAGVVAFCWADSIRPGLARLLGAIGLSTAPIAILALPAAVGQGFLPPALVALALPVLARWRPRGAAGAGWRFVLFIARVSYPLYLIQVPVFAVAMTFVAASEDRGGAVCLAVAVAFVAAHLLHVTVERPMMDLRDRLNPTPTRP